MKKDFVNCRLRLTEKCIHSSNPIMQDILDLTNNKGENAGFIPHSKIEYANDKLCKTCVGFEPWPNNEGTHSMDSILRDRPDE